MTAPALLYSDAPRPQASARLVCFPHAGGSPSFFRGWGRNLPDVEVYVACYPGRAERIEEPPPTDLCRLAVDLAAEILPLADRPLALFGHSLGAVVALEVARELERRGVSPCHLFASGSRAAPLPDRDPDGFDDDPDAVLAQLVRTGGTDPELATDPMFQELVLPYVIADGRMFHAYAAAPRPVLRCPITTIVGDADPDADQRPWHDLTVGEVREVTVPGDHFYLSGNPPYGILTAAMGGATGAAAPDGHDPESLRERDDRYVWHPWSPISAERDRLMIVRGSAWWAWDADGNRYLDAGSMNSTCGYGHPYVVEAAARQLSRMHGVDLSANGHDVAGELAGRLASHLPDSLSRTLFVNSGSEGIEAATMIAAAYHAHVGDPRTRVVTFARGYHGSTHLARSLSALPPTAHYLRDPLPVTRVEFPVSTAAMRDPETLRLLVSAFERAVGADASDRPSAVLVEPIVNVGGGVLLPPGFLRALRELCDATGTLLILDEVFTGYGRTGRMFAFEHDGAVPDILVSSKGLSGGYAPIAAVTVREPVYRTFDRDPVMGGLRYGHTTSGHAVACAAAVATLEVIEKEDLVTRSREVGAYLLDELAALRGRGAVTDVRGLGLAVILELASEPAATDLVAAARRLRLLVRQHGAAVMLVPPLTIGSDVADLVVDRITAAATGSGAP
ncbi:aminotransferase class III-fold pyridoxal phosphate-dependent enzyme [Actinomycetes bacterium KLBMP 9797]